MTVINTVLSPSATQAMESEISLEDVSLPKPIDADTLKAGVTYAVGPNREPECEISRRLKSVGFTEGATFRVENVNSSFWGGDNRYTIFVRKISRMAVCHKALKNFEIYEL